MKARAHSGRLLLTAIFVALDALVARLAVEIDAAGALLSPGGGVSAEALVTAGAFVLVRLAAIALLASTAGLFVADLVRVGLERVLERQKAVRAASTSRS